MRKKRNRNKNYKFTEKKKSIRGACACVGAVLSIAFMGVMLLNAVGKSGNGGKYLGSIGVLALFVSVVSFIEAVQALQEKNTFKTLPYIGIVLSAISTVLWIGLYFLGILL